MIKSIIRALIALIWTLTSWWCLALILPAPPSPSFRAFGDNQYWITLEDMTYVIGNTSQSITVPKGFVTDFASIPRGLWLLGLSPYGQYGRAAVIHDYLYWAQGCTKDQADRLLVIAMKESAVNNFDELAIYKGVSLGGNRPWKANAAERKEGLPRVVPEIYLRPVNPNINWPKYRALLIKNRVKDPVFEQNPPFCVLGNSTRVP